MVFTTPIFLFAFLPMALALDAIGRGRLRLFLLTASSFVFYGWWRPDFVLLMCASAGLDFWASHRIEAARSPRARKVFLILSVVANLSLLGYFKYANFGVDTFNALIGRFGIAPIGALDIVLPVGISFYTFQSMSYTIDVYRREIRAENSFIVFLCYVSLFPQLVAGPIVRYADVAAQLMRRSFTFASASAGALLFQLGFAKKVLIADSLAPVADGAFALADPSVGDAWIGILAYAFQIYFDFSGYSDMAIGLGAILGLTFPINFDGPYRSKSITEFWRRWHISLSTWLRDYLYIPMGGNRRGPRATYLFLVITMLLGGLWHGAAWTFVAWGAYQGAWLALERMNGKRPFHHRLPGPLQVATTFVIALVGWVFFRAVDMGQATSYIAAMSGFGGHGIELTLGVSKMAAAAFVVAAGLVWVAPTSRELIDRWGAGLLPIATIVFVMAVGQTYFQSWRPFLYFQF